MLRLSEGRGIPGGVWHTVRGERFGPLGFVRISKSAAVNVYKVRQLTADMNMRMQLLLDNGEKVVLNRSYKNEFLQFIKERRMQK